MQAAQVVSSRKIEILDVPMPDFAAAPDGALLIRTMKASICGSDLPFFLGTYGSFPQPVGVHVHECIGTVVASKSSQFGEGDQVMALPSHDGFAEYFLTGSHQSVIVPEGLSLNEALMAQPLGTVICALRTLPPMLHLNVAVIGQGPIGQLMTAMVRSLGARRIIGIDKLDYRLNVSRKMGATHTINADKENAAAVVNDLTEGKGADIVFEAVGHNTDTINQAMRLTRVGGTVLVFGVPDIDTYPIDYTNFFRKNLRLVASVTSTQPALDHGLAMELIARGQIDVRPMISHELPYTEVQRGIDMVADRTDNALKVIFNFPM